MNDPVVAAVDKDLRRPRTDAQQPMLLTVTEAARLLRISRNLCYELIAQKQLPHIRLGRRILLPRYGLEQWIAHEAGLPQPSSGVVSWRPPRH